VNSDPAAPVLAEELQRMFDEDRAVFGVPPGTPDQKAAVSSRQRARLNAHCFRGNELVVVFRDAAFRITSDPASWGPPIEHGSAAGVPREQLDFHPRTRAAAEAFFQLG